MILVRDLISSSYLVVVVRRHERGRCTAWMTTHLAVADPADDQQPAANVLRGLHLYLVQ
jgi:hypothetical protein